MESHRRLRLLNSHFWFWTPGHARTSCSQAFCGALKARPKASRHQYPLVCAHGGDTARHAPNTLAAFRSAIEAGARCVEVDASLSLDAVPVAIHQREFRRMVGDASADVGFAKLDKITKLDAALGLPRSVSRANATVSTLKEVVLEIAPLVETLIVDVKTSNRHRNVKTAGGVSIVLRNARCANCVVWSKADSVTNNVMNSCREAGVVGGEVLLNDTAQAIREGMHRPFRLKAAGALAVHHAMLDEDLVERARQSGMRVFGWTANEPYMMRQVMASGADAVVTNEPQDFERAAEAWRQRCARKDERI